MNSEIEAVINALRDNLDGGEGRVALQACETVETWARAGKTKELVELAAALEEKSDPTNEKARAGFEAVADHVEDQLALVPGDAAVDAVITLALRERVRSVSLERPRDLRLRALASRLGYGQTPATFLSALDRAGSRADLHELFACWQQEVVLRGNALAKDARATRFFEHLTKTNHPLAMPLELCGTEREVPSYMPLYGDKGLGRAIETLTSGPMSARTVPPPADGAAVHVKRVDDGALAGRVETAVRPWTEGSKGKCEAKLFEIAPAVKGGALGSWLLRALPLDATKGTARLDVTRAEDPSAVFGALFSAASNGGAYSAGLGGAYGRRAAWASLGALVGAPADASITAIDELAVRSAFLTFRAPGPWFYDVAWDLGVLALRPDGATACVLAATDTE